MNNRIRRIAAPVVMVMVFIAIVAVLVIRQQVEKPVNPPALLEQIEKISPQPDTSSPQQDKTESQPPATMKAEEPPAKQSSGRTPAVDAPGTPPETATPDATVVDPIPAEVSRLNSGFSEKLDAVASRYGCAAVSLAVFDIERGFYTYQYGYADRESGAQTVEDTKFRVASLSKLVTAICAMRLADAGKIDLDADISEYLGYFVKNPNYPETPITCRMLLQHTSSLYDSDAFLTSRAAYSSRSSRQLLDAGTSYMNREPGSTHEYANFGFAILGDVCEKVYGEPIDILARDLLFEPLGIDAAYTPVNLRDTSAIAVIYNESHSVSRSVKSQLDVSSSQELGRDHHLAQGNLTISALDYARILAMLVNDGTIDGVRILSESAVREIHDTNINNGVYDQGLAVRYQDNAFMGEGVFWHTGSAYGELTQFVYDKSTGYGVVVITTGARSDRETNGMVTVCTKLSETVWRNTVDLPLDGMVVCVDPGHQGRGDSSTEPVAPGSAEVKPKVASGTSGVFSKTPEHVLNLEVGIRLCDKLESLGATVIMTRTGSDVNISNAQRAQLANVNECDMTIRIHADGSDDPAVRGYSILVPDAAVTPGIVDESTRMALLLDEAIKISVTIPSRGLITRGDLTGFNWLEVPGVLIEMGYMTNELDDRIMAQPEFQDALVAAIADALKLYWRGA